MVHDIAPALAQHCGLVRQLGDQDVAILADGLSHPAQHFEATAGHQDQRPQANQPALAVGRHDGERCCGGLGGRQIVIGPVPVPIEGLEQVRVATRAGQQSVPLRLEGIEAGAVAHDGDGECRRPAVGRKGCGLRRGGLVQPQALGVDVKRGQLVGSWASHGTATGNLGIGLSRNQQRSQSAPVSTSTGLCRRRSRSASVARSVPTSSRLRR